MAILIINSRQVQVTIIVSHKENEIHLDTVPFWNVNPWLLVQNFRIGFNERQWWLGSNRQNEKVGNVFWQHSLNHCFRATLQRLCHEAQFCINVRMHFQTGGHIMYVEMYCLVLILNNAAKTFGQHVLFNGASWKHICVVPFGVCAQCLSQQLLRRFEF